MVMVLEEKIITYACSVCQKTYNQKEDARKCEFLCDKLSKSFDISILKLKTKTYNKLKIAGIDTVDEVRGMTDSYLLKLKGFGPDCLHNLRDQLQLFSEQNKRPGTLMMPLNYSNTRRSFGRQKFSKTNPFDSAEWINRLVDLPELLKNQVTQFVDSQDWVGLYRDYQWNYDTWGNGFPYILQLEKQLRFSRQNGHIKGKDVLDVVHWGMFKRKITSPDSISIVEEVLKSDERSSLLQTLITLEQNVEGLEATHLSKVLRFAFPDRAGTLDSGIIRAFGIGDPTMNQYQWLSIRTHKLSSTWVINRDRMWLSEYEKWLQILTKMVIIINNKGVVCPHPRKFVDAGLRTDGAWICADVEMAIYTYLTRLACSCG